MLIMNSGLGISKTLTQGSVGIMPPAAALVAHVGGSCSAGTGSQDSLTSGGHYSPRESFLLAAPILTLLSCNNNKILYYYY